MRSFGEQRDFRDLLLADPAVTAVLSEQDIDEAFDLGAQLRNVDVIFDRVFGENRAQAASRDRLRREAAPVRRSQERSESSTKPEAREARAGGAPRALK